MLLQVACFLHRELPIRLSHRVRDLDAIPYLMKMPSAQEVLDSIDKGSYGFAGNTVVMLGEVVENPSSSLLLPNIKNREEERRAREENQYKIAEKEIDKILDETPDIGGPPTSAGSKPTFQGQIRATQRRVEEGNGGMLFQLRRR